MTIQVGGRVLECFAENCACSRTIYSSSNKLEMDTKSDFIGISEYLPEMKVL